MEDTMNLSVGDIRDDEHWIESSVLRRGKVEIEEAVREFIETHLNYTDSGTLYLFLKQLEYGVKLGIEQLKDNAFTVLGGYLGGVTSGKFHGHEIAICYPNEWNYSSAVEFMKEQHKKELMELQEKEKREKIAFQMPGKARLTVTLREQ